MKNETGKDEALIAGVQICTSEEERDDALELPSG